MYSRNTSGRNVRRREPMGQKNDEKIAVTEEYVEKIVENEEITEVGAILPEPPPNYRGMIYDISGTLYGGINAEGIERLVENDSSYSDRRRVPQRRGNRTYFSHLNPPLPKTEKQQESGIRKIIDGLNAKNFEAEDILICAMIMLMLNSKSEDDILMILVLMMLL
ncbi:MAG: hypothetical protein IJD37_01595 [Clostridia bacterium]|nr:hypothetical protein [Clostridia bacterium]